MYEKLDAWLHQYLNYDRLWLLENSVLVTIIADVKLYIDFSCLNNNSLGVSKYTEYFTYFLFLYVSGGFGLKHS